MTQLLSVPTSNYQPPTSTDHRTVMHRQQNPPNVPIIELGELVGRDISWGRSDCRNTAPVPSFRGSPAWGKDLSDWMGDLDTDTFVSYFRPSRLSLLVAEYKC